MARSDSDVPEVKSRVDPVVHKKKLGDHDRPEFGDIAAADAIETIIVPSRMIEVGSGTEPTGVPGVSAPTGPVWPVVPRISATKYASELPGGIEESCAKSAAKTPVSLTSKTSGPGFGLLPPVPQDVHVTKYSKFPKPSNMLDPGD